jgi:hypothetical protein
MASPSSGRTASPVNTRFSIVAASSSTRRLRVQDRGGEREERDRGSGEGDTAEEGGFVRLPSGLHVCRRARYDETLLDL